MTLIALSIAVHSPAQVPSAVKRAVRGAEIGADLIEWRVEELAAADDALAAIQTLIQQSPLPSIITCRAADEGGDFEGPEQRRLELIASVAGLETPPRYLDVELTAFERDAQFRGRIRHLLEQSTSSDGATRLILSAHDFHGRPRDLLQKIEAMSNEPVCGVMKIAWHARSLRDNLEAFELLRARHKPLIALCMGQFGLMSRVLAGKFGGFLTFASDHATEVTAPGQPTIEELKQVFRFDHIKPTTKVYGVIGWPVEHSRSPQYHNAGFEGIGFDGVFLPLPIPPEYEHFKATVSALIDLDDLNFRGASVTIPHKENLVRLARDRGGRLDEMSEMIGAANTLMVGSDGALECANTDGPAAIDALCAGMSIVEAQLRGKRIAILGAGGAARSIVAALCDMGSSVTIFNRNRARAEQLVADLGCDNKSKKHVFVGDLTSLQHERFDIYINCTPIGMSGGSAPKESPLPSDAPLDQSSVVMDAVYSPPRTPLIQQAEMRGAHIVYGSEMFTRQAARQFELWTRTTMPDSSLK
jgi:3-dehydroquinate dehydratase/shikimate dehydrogenase